MISGWNVKNESLNPNFSHESRWFTHLKLVWILLTQVGIWKAKRPVYGSGKEIHPNKCFIHTFPFLSPKWIIHHVLEKPKLMCICDGSCPPKLTRFSLTLSISQINTWIMILWQRYFYIMTLQIHIYTLWNALQIQNIFTKTRQSVCKEHFSTARDKVSQREH